MEIAIVDDIKDERTLVRKLTSQYFQEGKALYDIDVHFDEYEDAESFLESYTPGKYKIVFLDIYMKQLTGIDAAKQIAALDTDCSIIFFTTSDEHQLEGYSVHAVGYIMKPLTDHLPAFYTAMDYVLGKLHLDTASITVPTDYGELNLYYKNIMYIDCIDRSVCIHLPNSTLKISGKFQHYERTFLSDTRFLLCYRNIIVNMDYIDRPIDCDFILKSGEKLPISRRKKSPVLESYMTYFIRRRGI